tara:strand:- start:93 stop:947 length:855 start_codon:yes stop_codon:yes gene_type:complete
MNIDTLILSGGGPSGVAYFGIFKALFEKNIITKNLDGIREIITTSVGIIPSIFFILKLPIDVGLEIIMNYDLNILTNMDSITIDSILVDFGLFNNQGISDLVQSIIKNYLKKEDLTLQELYEISKIKLTVKVFNVTRKQLEYISYENYPELSILTLSQMTTAIPLFFKPIEYNNCSYVDGGLRGHFPIEECKSKNYLGLFIKGGSFPNNSSIIELFPILEFLYSLMINQDQVVYDIKENKGSKQIIYVEVNYGLNFNMSMKDKEKIINYSYQATRKHITEYLDL